MSLLVMLVCDYLYIYQREGGLSCFNATPFLHHYIGHYYLPGFPGILPWGWPVK